MNAYTISHSRNVNQLPKFMTTYFSLHHVTSVLPHFTYPAKDVHPVNDMLLDVKQKIVKSNVNPSPSSIPPLYEYINDHHAQAVIGLDVLIRCHIILLGKQNQVNKPAMDNNWTMIRLYSRANSFSKLQKLLLGLQEQDVGESRM